MRELDERRSKHRFGLSYDLDYSVVGQRTQASGHGQSINISSGGILFTTERVLYIGNTVQADLRWPVKLDNQIALKLTLVGTIVRVESGSPLRAAMRINRHEFRTFRD
jgi:hypothetical protein